MQSEIIYLALLFAERSIPYSVTTSTLDATAAIP